MSERDAQAIASPAETQQKKKYLAESRRSRPPDATTARVLLPSRTQSMARARTILGDEGWLRITAQSDVALVRGKG